MLAGSGAPAAAFFATAFSICAPVSVAIDIGAADMMRAASSRDAAALLREVPPGAWRLGPGSLLLQPARRYGRHDGRACRRGVTLVISAHAARQSFVAADDDARRCRGRHGRAPVSACALARVGQSLQAARAMGAFAERVSMAHAKYSGSARARAD